MPRADQSPAAIKYRRPNRNSALRKTKSRLAKRYR